MQIQTSTGGGTVEVENGSNVVYSQPGIDWSQVIRGCWFVVAGSGIWYTITADAVLAGDVWHITLAANYGGLTDAAADYAIQKDFAQNGAPIIAVGDTEWMGLLNRWMQAQSSIGGEFGGNGLITKQIPITGDLIGAMEIYCAFDPELSDVPSYIARPFMIKGHPAEDNIDAVTGDTVSKFGFNINLSGPAIAGQVLHCGWIRSVGSSPPPPPPPLPATGQLLSQDGGTLLSQGGQILHVQ